MENNIFTKRTFFLLLTGVGLVLFWRGIWDVSARFMPDYISLIIGLAVLILVAVYQKRQFFQFFGG